MVPVTDADTIKACVLGQALGDALGVPVEFTTRAQRDADPVEDLRGFSRFPVPAGAWSDDTSMALCALEALTRVPFTWEAVMDNFVRWLYHGGFTPTGKPFGVGRTCALAVSGYAEAGLGPNRCGQRDEQSNGNGSLMRILPFALYGGDDPAFIAQASALTHAHRRSQMACGIYAQVLRALLADRTVSAWQAGYDRARAHFAAEPEWQHFAPLANIESRSRDSIRSSGYVVDTLEAALWCLVTTDSYRDCVLTAVNLGGDTDTVAAVAGGLAGAVYGLSGIPTDWLARLLRREDISALCGRAAEVWRA